MATYSFIGREKELERLEALRKKEIPGLVVVKGRRRIGKSRLIAEFAARKPRKKLWSFSGLAPQDGITAQNQRDHFAGQLATVLKLPPLTFLDWSDAFAHLSLHAGAGDVILFDEISWMGAKDPGFIPKLKAWWDSQKKPFIVVFCGSVSTWIEENILKSTAFFGRINLTLTLEPLSIKESAELIRNRGFKGSAYDLYKLLGVIGGIPWYLEQLGRGMTADELIKRLCFEKDGLLVNEFESIFHDLFNGKGTAYKKILVSLREGMKTLAEIRKDIDFAHSGKLSQMAEHLITGGFVKKQALWSFKTMKPLKQSLYSNCDPYIRFYLKVIAAHRGKIDSGTYEGIPLSGLPGIDAHMGLQLEYLLLRNRETLLRSIGINAVDVINDGPYRQTKTSKGPGCQVDYLVQTSTKNLFVCEFKFMRREIGPDIIEVMSEKINALRIPKGFSAVPVLFHIGGVAPSVETGGFFYRVIDIADFLE